MISWASIGFTLWLGILTSISPCPLATNIAAISYLGRQVGENQRILLAGLSYTLGRVSVYLVLGIFLVSSTRMIPAISLFLQTYMSIVIGPVLWIVGLILLNVIRLNISGNLIGQKTQERLSKHGIKGAFFIGFLFALSFCPVSAALFFGNTIGLAIRNDSKFLIPILFGFGTALPVVLFSFVIAFSVNKIGIFFNSITKMEKWLRLASGIVFLIVGSYYIYQSIIFFR
ncbi:sulfite exporter TauE/SafE family protein [candidate division KSB1 bacterium]|nr:sulfite exporter TauE/SafE family protein [candidate division KSB1 bacterium]